MTARANTTERPVIAVPSSTALISPSALPTVQHADPSPGFLSRYGDEPLDALTGHMTYHPLQSVVAFQVTPVRLLGRYDVITPPSAVRLFAPPREGAVICGHLKHNITVITA